MLVDETPRDLADLAAAAVDKLSKAAAAFAASAASAPDASPARITCMELEPLHDAASGGDATAWLFPRSIAVAATVSTVSKQSLKLEAAIIASGTDRVHSVTLRLERCTGKALAITILLLEGETDVASGTCAAASSAGAAGANAGAGDAAAASGTLVASSMAVRCVQEAAHCGHGGECIEISDVRIFVECTDDS